MDPAVVESRRGVLNTCKWYKHTPVDYELLENFGLNRARTILAQPVWNILRPNEPTYKALMIEFLSTLHDPRADMESIRFRLRNKWYTLSTDRLKEAFGNPTDGDQVITGGPGNFWDSIAKDGVEWRAGAVVNRSIRCASLRFMQCVIARTIFARGESPEKISTQDLTLLWGMVHSTAVDVAHLWRAITLIRVARENPGHITAGPYVTLIARHVGALDSNPRTLEKPDATLYRPLTDAVMNRWRFRKRAPVRQEEEVDDDDDDDDDADDDAPPPAATGFDAPRDDAGPSSSRRRPRDTWDMGVLEDRLTGIENSLAAQNAWLQDWRNNDLQRWKEQQAHMRRVQCHVSAQQMANRAFKNVLTALATNKGCNVRQVLSVVPDSPPESDEDEDEDYEQEGPDGDEEDDSDDEIDEEMSDGEARGEGIGEYDNYVYYENIDDDEEDDDEEDDDEEDDDESDDGGE